MKTRRRSRPTRAKRRKHTYRKRVGAKPLWGGAKPISATLIRTTLPRYFSKDQVKFELAGPDAHYKITVHCSEKNTFTHKNQNGSITTVASPMYALIHYTTMSLEKITRCDGKSGKEILQTWIAFARDIGIKKIELMDAAIIYIPGEEYGKSECGISLSALLLLSKGESWYERMGFRSRSYEEDHKQNEVIRSLDFPQFIELVANRLGVSAESYLDRVYEAMPELREIKITSDVFSYLEKFVLRAGHPSSILSCKEDPRLQVIQEMLRAVEMSPDPILHYRPELSMKL
jgi:hypothetical protein